MDQFHKSQNAPVPYPKMLHSEQKCAHFCSEWSILGYGTGAFWDIWIRAIWVWCGDVSFEYARIIFSHWIWYFTIFSFVSWLLFNKTCSFWLSLVKHATTMQDYFQFLEILFHDIFVWFINYHQTFNIRHTLVGNKIVDHSDVVGALPCLLVRLQLLILDLTPGFNGLGKDNCKMRWSRNN